MKSAQQRAEEMAEWAGLPPGSPGFHAWVERSVGVLKELLRDQRHLCADATNACRAPGTLSMDPLRAVADALDAAHAAVLNTRAPGE